MAHPNQELLQRAYDAFGRGDVPAVLALLADDVKWHAGGRSPVAGEYEGHEGVVSFFTKLMERSGGTFRLEIHDITASDDHVVALVHETGERGTKTLDENFVHVWHVTDGKATEFWGAGADQYAWDEFWA
jgi:ketosteroid isomerase-like protein